jgi:hypothetical protein
MTVDVMRSVEKLANKVLCRMEPGYDGKYGRAGIFEAAERREVRGQMRLP